MTTIQAPATTWHTNVHVNGDPYPTRNYTPNTDDLNYDCIGLTPQQANHLTAIHETGHAITALAGGGHLHYAQIGPVANNPSATADVHCCNLVDDNGHAQAIYYAAGERAADRWLHEAGLWTPRRAVGRRSRRQRRSPQVSVHQRPPRRLRRQAGRLPLRPRPCRPRTRPSLGRRHPRR